MSNEILRAFEDEREDAQAVVNDLFATMDSMVTEYDDQAIKIRKRIDGTAFFPGGVGLWRERHKNGLMPQYFTKAPVMMLAHNFDAELLFNDSVDRGIEKMDEGTWKGLLQYLAISGLTPERCFFTNVFVQAGNRVVRMKGLGSTRNSAANSSNISSEGRAPASSLFSVRLLWNSSI